MLVENLESRRLLSTSVSVSNSGVLSVNGNGDDDQIAVNEDHGTVFVAYTDKNGVFHDPSGSLGTTDNTTFTGITAIRINGGGGDDTIFYTGNTIGADIHGDNQQGSAPRDGRCGRHADERFVQTFIQHFGGREGNQGGSGHHNGGTGGGSGHHNSGGSGGNAAAGNDFITVSDDGTGSSTVNGDGGDDTITVLHGNNTAVLGGAGNDQIFLNSDTSRTDGTTNVNAGAGNDTITIYSGTNTVNGGSGTDTVLEDVPASNSGDLNGSGAADPAQQTLISIEHVETF